MRLNQIRNSIFCGLIAVSCASQALEVDVGRATISLNGENWQAVADEKQEGTVNGGDVRNFDIKQKTWFLTDGSKKVKAILRIRGTASGISSNYGVSFGGGCKKIEDPNVYTKDNTGGSLKQMDCLRIYHFNQSAGLLNQVYKVEQAYAKDKGMSLPNKGSFVTNMVTMSSGTFLDISIFAGEDWSGPSGSAIEGIPAAIKPEVAAWADEMAKAARGSVRSFSGKMVMPPLEFK
jgi:hypothetical protein